MKLVAIVLAALSSFVSLLVLTGGGLALLAIEVSGERGVGALLAACGLAASAAVAALIGARYGTFGSGLRRAAAIVLAMVGAAPPAILAFLAFSFARSPWGSPVPTMEWAALAGAILLGVGVVSILAIGHWRSQEHEEHPLIHMQQIRDAQQQLRSAFEADTLIRAARKAETVPQTDDGFTDDEVRVRRV